MQGSVVAFTKSVDHVASTVAIIADVGDSLAVQILSSLRFSPFLPIEVRPIIGFDVNL